MPPFSNKKKKEQLKNKRQMKREREDDPNSFYRTIMQKPIRGKKPQTHQQNLDNAKRVDADGRERFADLQFFKDTDEEIRLRKEQSLFSIIPLKEHYMEVDANCLASSLDMPKRPPWNKSLSKDQLDRQEQIYFKEFVDKLLSNSLETDKKLSYFDLNLDTWRQLWRVIEMSEVVTIIVDIRHPLFHFPPTLYRYIVEELNKHVIIVLNKVDLVSASLILAWHDYLKAQYPEVHIIPFASYAGMKQKANGKRVGMLHMATDGAKRFMIEVESIVGPDKIDFTSWRQKIQDELAASGLHDDLTPLVRKVEQMDIVGEQEDSSCTESTLKLKGGDWDSQDRNNRPSSHTTEDADEAIQEHEDFSEDDTRANRKLRHRKNQKKTYRLTHREKAERSRSKNKPKEFKVSGSESDSDGSDSDDENNFAKRALLNAQHIKQDSDTTHYREEKYKDGILTIGCVGQPNVGKSSFMNALIGRKLVSVSRTPGHTKHFQTIFLTPNIRLCDCPGLVFPSYHPKPLQVLMGCYPISQLREPYSSITYLAERIDMPTILKLQPIDDIRHQKPASNSGTYTQGQKGTSEEWSAFSICESWAVYKGFLTARSGRPDVYRAANHLLRMALDGRTLCLSFYPPDYLERKSVYWEKHEDIKKMERIQGRHKIINQGDF